MTNPITKFLIVVSIALAGCGTKNLFDCDGGLAKSKCVKRTKDKGARIALDSGNMTLRQTNTFSR